jgi:Fe2+ or Zn2+ uptake regulation protein
MARGDPQINIRLAPDRYAVLEAAVFVHRAGTPAKLIQRQVEEAIDSYAKLPTVQKALEALREQTAAEEGKLSHLAVTRRRSARDSSA